MIVNRIALLVASGVIALSGCADNTQKSATPTQSATPSAIGTRVTVPSHCGVLSVTVNGRLWLADPPLGGHNPPHGWDENETSGLFVVVGHGRGEFHGDEGQRASFRRAPVGAENPNAGCE